MSMSISFEGLTAMKQAIADAKREVRAEVERAVATSVNDIHGAAKKRIQHGPASGATYQSSVSEGKLHVASAPGEPPMSDSGDLASSIAKQTDGLTGYVFTPLDYGRFLEFGTSKMKPRPWLLPSLEEEAPKFRDRLQRILQ